MPDTNTPHLPLDTTSLEQPLLTSLAQCEAASKEALVDALTLLSKTNGINVIQHGARLAVIGDLLVSMLTYLPGSMRADIAKTFRARIEHVMSMGDDRGLPEKYHSALLSEVNRYLNTLR